MISSSVMQELEAVRQVLHYLPSCPKTDAGWSMDEQERFWEAITHFPHGPWTSIAEYIGTKSTRQAMTHGQKLRLKLNRWKKRLRRRAPTTDPDAVGSEANEPLPLLQLPTLPNDFTSFPNAQAYPDAVYEPIFTIRPSLEIYSPMSTFQDLDLSLDTLPAISPYSTPLESTVAWPTTNSPAADCHYLSMGSAFYTPSFDICTPTGTEITPTYSYLETYMEAFY